VDGRQLGRVALDERGGKGGLKAASGSSHGTSQ
jgi:hypothetical protein